MNFIVDVCLLGVLLCFIVNGYKNGLIKSMLSLTSTFFSIFISSALSNSITNFLYEKLVYGLMSKKLSLIINNAANNDNRVLPSEIIKVLPDFIVSGFDNYNITETQILSIIRSSSLSIENNLMDIFRPVIINFMKPIVIIFLFIIFSIILKFFTMFICKIIELPILSGINSILGACLGIIKFSIITMLFVFVIRLAQPFINDSSNVFSERMINDTFILSKMYHSRLFEDSIRGN